LTQAAIEALLAVGTTHVGDISQSGLGIEPLLASGLAGVVYVEIIGLEKQAALDFFARARQIVENYRPYERNGMRLGLTPHAPYSTHPAAFRAATAYALKEEVPLCIQLAESQAETAVALHKGHVPSEAIQVLCANNRVLN
jgi:cytosine/adenosine deaminase-related metal-dependent hydrolase